MNAWGILASRRCGGTTHIVPLAFSNPRRAPMIKVILGIKQRCQQELLSLMAENGNACMTSEYLSPTPGFFAPYLVCIFLALRSAPLRYESWTLKRRLVAT